MIGWTVTFGGAQGLSPPDLISRVRPSSPEYASMKANVWMPLAIALVVASSIVSCTSSSRTTESTGEYVDDAAITSKVKTALLNDSGLKSFDISVETYKDVVQLSGFVNTDQVKARATEVTASVSGVRSVKNNLVVK
jgi:osmotically-inducible protein OsmY